MALAGKGAIIIWNDVTPEALAQFHDWHNNEHMPERLGIPGFRRGNRYIARPGQSGQMFLTLYELADRGIATSAPYLARLNAPSDWSRSTMLQFRNMVRALTEVEVTLGAGHGGAIAAIRFDDSETGKKALASVRSNVAVLEETVRMPRVAGVHLCITDNAASAAKTTESRHRGDFLVAPVGVVLIEGCDAEAVDAAVAALLARTKLDGSSGVQSATFLLENTLSAS